MEIKNEGQKGMRCIECDQPALRDDVVCENHARERAANWQIGTCENCYTVADLSDFKNCPHCGGEIKVESIYDDMVSEVESLRDKIEEMEAEREDLQRASAARDSAILQAKGWAQEARTQRAIVIGIGDLVGCGNDWEMVGAVKAALEQAKAAPVAVPDGWILVPIEPTPGQIENASATDQLRMIARAMYAAMIEAAPPAPAVDEQSLRREFEKWWADLKACPPDFENDKDGAWKGWKASARLRSQQQGGES